MENKDIEKLLKESAEEVKVKDFSERWENIKGRIDSPQQVAINETTSETVLATSANTDVSHNTVRNKFIISVCAVFLLIALCVAVVLPLILKKNNPIHFFALRELTGVTVSENEFYESIEKSDLKIVDLKKFEASSHSLLYTDDNILVGGDLNIVDATNGVVSEVVFYNSSVKSSFKADEDYKSYSVNDFKIDYKTELNAEELYSTKAKAVGASISYELECLSLDENIEAFFEKFFG